MERMVPYSGRRRRPTRDLYRGFDRPTWNQGLTLVVSENNMTINFFDKQKIDVLTHEQLARRWRFLPAGDPFWQGELGKYAKDRLTLFGGITTEMSKRIGWENPEPNKE